MLKFARPYHGDGLDWITTTTILHELRDYGNRSAWESFSARFRRPIVSFVKGMGLSDIDAEDVAQETLIAFAEGYRRGQYDRTKGRLSRWLFGIAYRQALSGRRAGARQAGRDGYAVADTTFWAGVSDHHAEVSWDQAWEQALLEQCLDRVRAEVEPVTFRAFELVVRGERSATQAADELNVPIKVVYNAKHRILKRVRELRVELEEIQ
jgi:RNA polymerase sigma factor (sigma-70 family)